MILKGQELKDEPQKKGFAGREPLADLKSARAAKILLVFCDSHYEQSNRLLSEMQEILELPPLDSIRFSDLLASRDVKADMLLIYSLSPQTVYEKSEAMEAVIREFRNNNPGCAVVIMNLYGQATPAGVILHDLERSGLASILEGPAGYQKMIDAGAQELAKNGL